METKNVKIKKINPHQEDGFEKIDTNLVYFSLLAGVGAVAILFTGIFLIVKFVA